MGDVDNDRVVVFKQKNIRRRLHKGEWWFVIKDIVSALTDSTNPVHYLNVLLSRDEKLKELYDGKGVSQIETPLDLIFDTPGGKQKFKCWNTEGIFRLIQSIPSPKAEPLNL